MAARAGTSLAQTGMAAADAALAGVAGRRRLARLERVRARWQRARSVSIGIANALASLIAGMLARMAKLGPQDRPRHQGARHQGARREAHLSSPPLLALRDRKLCACEAGSRGDLAVDPPNLEHPDRGHLASASRPGPALARRPRPRRPGRSAQPSAAAEGPAAARGRDRNAPPRQESPIVAAKVLARRRRGQVRDATPRQPHPWLPRASPAAKARTKMHRRGRPA